MVTAPSPAVAKILGMMRLVEMTERLETDGSRVCRLGKILIYTSNCGLDLQMGLVHYLQMGIVIKMVNPVIKLSYFL